MPARERAVGPEVSRRVAASIKAERTRQGLSMAKLSVQMHNAGYGISAAVINSIENSSRMISVDEAVAFSEVLGVPVTDLLGRI